MTVPPAGSAPIPHAVVHLVGTTTVYKLSDVIAVADTVAGFEEGSGVRLAIPAASVRLVEAQGAIPAQTIGNIGTILLGTLMVLGVIVSYIVRHDPSL